MNRKEGKKVGFAKVSLSNSKYIFTAARSSLKALCNQLNRLTDIEPIGKGGLHVAEKTFEAPSVVLVGIAISVVGH